MWYYTYVLLSKKDGKFYTGYTEDLQGRFEAHSAGKVDATRERRPLELVYAETCKDRRDAIKREKSLKTHYGEIYLRKRLKSHLQGVMFSNSQACKKT